MPQVYTFVLDPSEVSVISEGLAELPFKKSKPVIDRMQAQINQQNISNPDIPADIQPACGEEIPIAENQNGGGSISHSS